MNDKVLFLPVKPKWADLILSGEKTLELRKRTPVCEVPIRVMIYASSPRKEVVGIAVCYGKVWQGVDGWSAHELNRACVTRAELHSYFAARKWSNALCLRDAVRFAKPIPLETLRAKWHLEPPQQWRYIDTKTFDEIVKAGQP
jgi:predicted transcriptional regulator